MNENQQVAQYLFEKMRGVMIPGEESEMMSSAKRWLALIANGVLHVQEQEPAGPNPDANGSGLPDSTLGHEDGVHGGVPELREAEGELSE